MKAILILLVSILFSCKKEFNNTVSKESNNVQEYSANNTNIVDLNGNIYHEIKISNQIWLKENLKATKLLNDTDIKISDSIYKETIPACQVLSDPVVYYNVLAVINKEYIKGYRIAAECDYDTLFKYYGTYCVDSLINGIFNLKKYGYSRYKTSFYSNGKSAYFWTSTTFRSGSIFITINDTNFISNIYGYSKSVGMSVKLIKSK